MLGLAHLVTGEFSNLEPNGSIKMCFSLWAELAIEHITIRYLNLSILGHYLVPNSKSKNLLDDDDVPTVRLNEHVNWILLRN